MAVTTQEPRKNETHHGGLLDNSSVFGFQEVNKTGGCDNAVIATLPHFCILDLYFLCVIKNSERYRVMIAGTSIYFGCTGVVRYPVSDLSAQLLLSGRIAG